MGLLLTALRRTVLTYIVLGLVVVSLSSASFSPLEGVTWQERALSAGQEILTWPRLLPAAGAAALELPLGDTE